MNTQTNSRMKTNAGRRWLRRMVQRIRCALGFHRLEIERPLSEQAALCKCSECGKRWAVYMAVGPNQYQAIPWAKAKPFYDHFSGTIREKSNPLNTKV